MKETLGDQIFSNAEKQIRSPDKQEAGDTAREYGKSFCEQLRKAIDTARAKGIRGKIYIQVQERPMHFARNCVQHTFCTRRSRPTPEQATYLYSHRDGEMQPKFEYCLPELQMVPFIMANQHRFTPKYIQDIRDWLSNRLT